MQAEKKKKRKNDVDDAVNNNNNEQLGIELERGDIIYGFIQFTWAKNVFTFQRKDDNMQIFMLSSIDKN